MTESTNVARIEWIVIPPHDLRAAETFYREVFGFSISPYSATYLVFKADNVSGALDQDLTPFTDSISFSLTVTNIDETLALTREHGGDIVKEKYELGPGAGHLNGQTYPLQVIEATQLVIIPHLMFDSP